MLGYEKTIATILSEKKKIILLDNLLGEFRYDMNTQASLQSPT